MKKFVQILLMTLVVVECFLFFGGYAVFDFSRRYYTAGAACAACCCICWPMANRFWAFMPPA